MDLMFDPDLHITNVLEGPEVKLIDSDGAVLKGISGVAGSTAPVEPSGMIGADRIIMTPGSAFELHTPPGAHILYVIKSRGFIRVDGVDYVMRQGDTVFVPANFAHGVKTDATADEPLQILAFG